MTEKGEAVKKDESAAAADTQAVDTNEGAAAQIEPDWKDLLRIERERSEKAERERDNYKQGLLSRKSAEKAQRQEVNETEGSDIEDRIAKALEPVVTALQGNKTEQILATLVTDPSKREYVKTLYQTRIQRTGTSEEAIRSDLETALALADSSKFAKENEELKRMNDNRTYIPPTGVGGAGDRSNVTQKSHKWTPEQEASLELRARANGIADVEKYKELAWKSAVSGDAFAVKKKYL